MRIKSEDLGVDSLIKLSVKLDIIFIIFTAFNFFTLTVVLLTTDKHLFIAPSSLVLFYILAPLIVVALHIYLIKTMAKYRKLLGITYYQNDKVLKELPFKIYKEFLIPAKPIYQILLKIFLFLTVFLFPFAVLFVIWLRFADYHHFIFSSYHLFLMILFVFIYMSFCFKTGFLIPIIKSKEFKITEILILLIAGIFLFLFIAFFIFFILRIFRVLEIETMLTVVLLSGLFLSVLVSFREYETETLLDGIKAILKYSGVIFIYMFLTIYIATFTIFVILNFHSVIYTISQRFTEKEIEIRDFSQPSIFIKSSLKNKIDSIRFFANMYIGSLANYIDLPILDVNNDTFENHQLIDRNLNFAILKNLILKNFNFKNIELFGSDIKNVVFENSSLEAVNLYSSTIRNVNFSKSKLENIDFKSNRLENVNFDKSSLKDVDLSISNLKNVNFIKAVLENINLSQTKLKNISFDQCSITNAFFNHLDTEKANFYGSKVKFTDISKSNSYIPLSNLASSDFSISDLNNTVLTGSILANGKFIGSNFKGANLMGANLYKADLLGSLFDGALLKGACSSSPDCNEVILLRIGKKVDLKGIENRIIEAEDINYIIRNWERFNRKRFPERWKKLLYAPIRPFRRKNN